MDDDMIKDIKIEKELQSIWAGMDKKTALVQEAPTGIYAYGDETTCTLRYEERKCEGCGAMPCGWNEVVIANRMPHARAIMTEWVKDHRGENGKINMPTGENPETKKYESVKTWYYKID